MLENIVPGTHLANDDNSLRVKVEWIGIDVKADTLAEIRFVFHAQYFGSHTMILNHFLFGEMCKEYGLKIVYSPEESD